MLSNEQKHQIIGLIFGIEPKTICELLDLDLTTHEDAITEFLAETQELLEVKREIQSLRDSRPIGNLGDQALLGDQPPS